MAPVTQRRHILRALGAAIAGGAAATLSGPAAAFRVIPADDMKGVLDEGCGATAYHRRLIDEAVQASGVTLSDEQRTALLAQLSCPTCRCPLAAFDNPAAGLRF